MAILKPMIIVTGAWSIAPAARHIQMGISRGAPRGKAAGYLRYNKLAPGDWFKSVTIPEYLTRYNAILAELDPVATMNEIIAKADGRVPVLCCFEHPDAIEKGEVWCHRHLVAQWLEDKTGVKIPELDHPDLRRFRKLELGGIQTPRYLT